MRRAAGLVAAGVLSAPMARAVDAPWRRETPASTTVAAADDAGAAPRSSVAATASSHVPSTPPLDLSPSTIRAAIQDSKRPEDDLRPAGGPTFGPVGGTHAAGVDRAFRAAELPSCLTADAFRFDAPVVSGVPFGGLFALPVWAHAIVTGRCRD